MADYSLWSGIRIKKGGDAGLNVSEEQKERIINVAVWKWEAMGLTDEQIAFGVATINIESGFNPYAHGPSKTEYGLGQFGKATWETAVKYHNREFDGDIDPDSSRYFDTNAQISVMGAWIDKIWPTAERYAANPALKDYDTGEIAYGLWHAGDSASVKTVEEQLKEYFAGAQYHFNLTHDQVNASFILRRHFSAPRKTENFKEQNLGSHSGETLRRDGDHVYRIEKDGSYRGYFISDALP